MIEGAVSVGIIQVSDTAKVRSFYEDTLGLEVIDETPFALVFEAGGTTLRVTPVPNFSPPAASVASWRVPDIEAVVRALTGRGVRFHGGEDKDELGIWSDPSGQGRSPDLMIRTATRSRCPGRPHLSKGLRLDQLTGVEIVQ